MATEKARVTTESGPLGALVTERGRRRRRRLVAQGTNGGARSARDCPWRGRCWAYRRGVAARWWRRRPFATLPGAVEGGCGGDGSIRGKPPPRLPLCALTPRSYLRCDPAGSTAGSVRSRRGHHHGDSSRPASTTPIGYSFSPTVAEKLAVEEGASLSSLLSHNPCGGRDGQGRENTVAGEMGRHGEVPVEAGGVEAKLLGRLLAATSRENIGELWIVDLEVVSLRLELRPQLPVLDRYISCACLFPFVPIPPNVSPDSVSISRLSG